MIRTSFAAAVAVTVAVGISFSPIWSHGAVVNELIKVVAADAPEHLWETVIDFGGMTGRQFRHGAYS